eukprot:Skav228273  [mRNA]  locus=scaffold7162:9256:10044:+ [translate_table: standard]
MGLGGTKPPDWNKNNSSRNTWATLNRGSTAWKVKRRTLNYDAGGGQIIPIQYVAPSDLVSYLMKHEPGVLTGGFDSPAEQALHLQAFWEGWRLANADHEVYREHNSNLSQILPLMLHGDEGRGKRRGNTVVCSCETPISSFTAVNVKKRRRAECDCSPPPQSVRKYGGVTRRLSNEHLAALRMQATTMKGHSFLHRFLMFIIPVAIHHERPNALMELLKLVALDLRRLFYEGFDAGGRHYAVAVIGYKGDLKWYKRIALERS